MPQERKVSQSSQSESLTCNLLYTLLKFVIDNKQLGSKFSIYEIGLLQNWVDPESASRTIPRYSKGLYKPLMVYLLAETELEFESVKYISYFVERFTHGQQIATLELLKSANTTRMS